MLRVGRFFGVAPDDSIEGLLKQSAEDQHDVTNKLGLQVRKAVEVLVQTFDRIDQDQNRALLAEVSEADLYESALTFMMRLVFLFSAEERGLLLLDSSDIYNQYYALSTLGAELRKVADMHGEELLERRRDAWCRLLATFRGIYGGIQHEDLRLPAYGGNLFNPDRFPFLEGRANGTSWRDTPARPLPVDNRTVLHLLESLQFLEVKGPSGGRKERQRLSFKALDIEQIGHVYEGLLDHTAVRAKAERPVMGLVGPTKKGIPSEPEIELDVLEEHRAKGDGEFLDFLKKEKVMVSKKAMEAELDSERVQRLRTACNNDEDLLERVLPFAGLLRNDSFGRPVVIPGGSIYVTQGTTRRETGTHYTPRALTEPIVQYTLEPLVYEGPAEGWPEEKWKLRSPKEILDLKVCDMAMGSGAFLVQTCRYLSERLVEAWEEVEERLADETEETAEASPLERATANVLARPSSKKLLDKLEPADSGPSDPPHPGPAITVEGEVATGAPGEITIPRDKDERLIYARRTVCERCLYGVDKNPLAVEMAKMSLWLITLDKNRAFTFLDHAFKTGDSLLGLWNMEQIEDFHIAPAEGARQTTIWGGVVKDLFDQAMAKRQELESFPVIDIKDRERKAQLLAESSQLIDTVRVMCDMLITASVTAGDSKKKSAAFDDQRDAIWNAVAEANGRDEVLSAMEAVRSVAADAYKHLNEGNPQGQPPRTPFHWPVEFPEIFSTSSGRGFSALVMNPPFQGGKKISGPLGKDYREFLIAHLASGARGHADLCAYFFLRAGQLARERGGFGSLATNTIAQGDTREVGLEQLLNTGFSIPRAVPSRKWPGAANLEVAHVWLHKGDWSSGYMLDDQPVKGITPFLSIPGKVVGKPYCLAANEGKSFQGSTVLGAGFIMTPERAHTLLERHPHNEDVLYPYLNGDDLNSRPDQSPSRWVVNFHDWPLDRSAEGSWMQANDRERKEYLRLGRVPTDYPDPVADDYPDCLAIVEEKVKPERAKNKDKRRREIWWRFTRPTIDAYRTCSTMKHVLVSCRHTKYICHSEIRSGQVFDVALNVLYCENDPRMYSLNSSLYEQWVRLNGSTLETRLRYTLVDCFETFPLPARMARISDPVKLYLSLRRELNASEGLGLTDIYNRFHSPEVQAQDIQRLRELHVEMDRAVADAYGWTDLDLGHGFRETKQGLRFTISEAARREVLDRLLALNHERYAEEVAQGLHDKKRKKKTPTRGRKKSAGDQKELF